MHKVGILFGSSSGADDPSTQSKLMELVKGLKAYGLIENKNIQLLIRHGRNQVSQIGKIARELITKKPDLLIVHTTIAVKEVQRLNIDIPVIFLAVSGPVESGIVKSLSRPGANFTGYQLFDFSITAKLVEIVRELAPSTKQVVLIAHKSNASGRGHLAAIKSAADNFGLSAKSGIITSLAEFETILSSVDHRSPTAYIFPPDGYFTGRAFLESIALLAKYRAPAIFGDPRGAELGGLASYGPDHIHQFYEAAEYVHKLLNGATAANLPVQQPRKFLFLINSRTANSLQIKIPIALLGRADRIIE